MTELERIKAEFEAWLEQQNGPDCYSLASFEAGWLAAKGDTIRTLREIGQALFPPKH